MELRFNKRMPMFRLITASFVFLSTALFAQRAGKVPTPPPTKPPLQRADVSKLPDGTTHLDIYLLCGQSNMKGRGVMPDEPKRDPRVVMMHRGDDQWYLARHPLHLTGDAQTFKGHDNAGVGPGLTFAEVMLNQDKEAAIALVPCAVGGSSIKVWQKGAKLYEDAVRRARLALSSTAGVKARIRGILWLQGEANANAKELPAYEDLLKAMIEAFRSDLGLPELPFIACTIGEMQPEPRLKDLMAMNQLLLNLPNRVKHTQCVDARELKTHIGDRVHFDTAAQEEMGRRFAAKMTQLVQP
ncbi:MAG: sialate O-acetylesterase [Verrucomicrobiaceae bacterium]|nr:sialate O-acetylesterase [Verrucomicrobiaceae bacterium]